MWDITSAQSFILWFLHQCSEVILYALNCYWVRQEGESRMERMHQVCLGRVRKRRKWWPDV